MTSTPRKPRHDRHRRSSASQACGEPARPTRPRASPEAVGDYSYGGRVSRGTRRDHHLGLKRWILDGLYYFDRRVIADWRGLMIDELERSRAVKPMTTARFTVQLLSYTADLRSAAECLAVKGHPAGRQQLVDAALDLRNALDRLQEARDALLGAAGADRVIPEDHPDA